MATVNGTTGNDFIHVQGDGLIAPVGWTDNALATGLADSILAGDGDDWLIAGDGDDTLIGGIGADTLVAGAGVDSLSGGGGNDVLVGTGGQFGTFSGGNGADVLNGGGGDDSYYVSLINAATIVEAADGGIDTLYVSDYVAPIVLPGVPQVFPRLADNIENLVVSAAPTRNLATPTFFANDLDNVITSTGSGLGGAYGHILNGLGGNDTYIVDSTNDQAIEAVGAGNDTVRSSVHWTLGDNIEALVLVTSSRSGLSGTGNALANTITGTNRNDTLIGLGGADTLIGGLGDDSYILTDADDRIVETEVRGAGRDTVRTSLAYTLGLNLENLAIVGAATATGNEQGNVITRLASGAAGQADMFGAGGNDQLFGGDNADRIFGGEGNDSLNGGLGNDTLLGGAGDDTYTVTTGDVITENLGEGIDLVRASTGFTLAANVENLLLLGTVGLSGVGNTLANMMTGTAGADSLFGGDGNDTLDGGANSDSMEGGSGDDTYYRTAGDQIVELVDGGVDTVIASQQASLADFVENLVLQSTATVGQLGLSGFGNAQANSITGTNGIDSLYGGGGNDSLYATGSADRLEGGDGDDSYYITDRATGIIEFGSLGGGIDTVYSGQANTVLAGFVENLVLNIPNFTLGQLLGIGNGLNNLMTTLTRAELRGMGGNDTLIGSNLNDTLVGGDGNDRLVSNTTNTASDVLVGGAGDDTYVISSNKDLVDETISFIDAGGIDTVESSVSVSLALYIENLTLLGTLGLRGTGNGQNNVITGTSGNDALLGVAGDDTIFGGDGSDNLDGGAGADLMHGGGGSDIYVVDRAGDVVVEAVDAGYDRVLANVNHRLSDNVEALELTAVAGGPTLVGTGNSLDNFMQIRGGAGVLQAGGGQDTLYGSSGNDYLNGATGTDEMQGGFGDDIYVVERTGDLVLEVEGGGIDRVIASANFTLGANVENLSLMGGVGLVGTGNALANQITGSILADVIYGGQSFGGDDTLSGNAGNDTIVSGLARNLFLYGGDGDDIIGFNPFDPNIILSTPPNILIDGGAGRDVADLSQLTNAHVFVDLLINANNVTGLTTVGVEGVITGMGNDVLMNMAFADSGDGNDTLGGTNAADVLKGGAGQDVLNGGLGADTMSGGADDDTYLVDNSADVVVELADGGNDTVRASVSYSLSSDTLTGFVENLILQTDAGATGGGNNLNNSITGGAGNDILTGFFGDDTLIGNGGNDRLIGGEGNDDLRGGTGNDTMTAALGADTMTGAEGDDLYVVSEVGQTIIEVDGQGIDSILAATAVFTMAANVEKISTVLGTGVTLTGNAIANDMTGGSGNDVLDGLSGNDTLYGGTGVDALVGGDLDDYLYGGAGNDQMFGGAGNDALFGQDLFGGTATGDDSMAGGTGDDIYYTSTSGTTITEFSSAGNDTVVTTLTSYTLGANLENVIAFTGSSVTLAGNDLANQISGLGGNDLLLGGNGNDTLNGTIGNDTLAGNAGVDTFVLATSDGVDLLLDFLSGTDKIGLRSTTLGIGDGDAVLENALTTAGGGWSGSNELVVFTTNTLAAGPEAAILVSGTASGPVAVGQRSIMVFDTGFSTQIYQFTAANTDNVVSLSELVLLATANSPGTSVTDYLFLP